MKLQNKIVIVLLVALVTFSALSVFTGSVEAAGNVSCQATVSSKSSGVGETTSYTFYINNTGQTNLGAANITIPSGYNNVGNLAISQQPASQSWTITKENNFILLNESTVGLNPGQSITFAFDAKNPLVSGTYKWKVGVNENATVNGFNSPDFSLNVSYSIVITSLVAATIIFFIAAGIAFLNTVINRVLINFFVGWEQYRVMQKEMNEFRAESMAAARANDKKQMEKIKKKQSQMNAMQAKMMKPQMVQLGISFVYIFVWIFVLTPTYGNTSLVYLPGFGPISVIYWYPIASFFLGLLASRTLGIMPIET